MHLLADSAYASTASGYVITALLTLLTGGFLAERAYQRREIAKQNDTLGLLSTSQAVLIAALPVTQASLDNHGHRLGVMETGYAVLAEQMKRHEAWHERHTP